MSTEKNIRIRQKADTAENWSKNNPILLKNELAIDTINRAIKLGGIDKPYSNCSYLYHPGDEYIEWGGKNIKSNNYGFSDASLMNELGARNN